ncbi:hypothetical protein [Alterisphingorhabdus coralli]|uniref:Uncharacterized protein n=1 Tax=Alterisphingorhabdus coralli TaxID=3071408 RepID=A0AA97I2A1_9SPHN|nr:hypothetical protein [Parasphingorhabdus sp. SCSIO 66989]WOE75575.1 hypothetical protein RB602_02355 [Parasphingorhabdus sp. SCSIO 66989]
MLGSAKVSLSLALSGSAVLLAAATALHFPDIDLTEDQRALLERELEDRVADDPVQCIPAGRQLKRMTVISDDLILYEVGNTIYANTPAGGCPRLERNNTLVTLRPQQRLCKGDIAQVTDFGIRAGIAGCSFSEFIPYRSVEEDE